jgi:Kef-type K+ transport system membrane component KefB
MTNAIIIALCLLLLLGYLFDLTASRSRIPSVVLLLFLGWLVKQGTVYFDIRMPDIAEALPTLGTVGLILIVLEGSLELELKRHKLPMIRKSLWMALVPFFILSLLMAWALLGLGKDDFRQNLINAIPLAVISSAIAIPTAKNLPAAMREFVVYESSLSDIIGVLVFNFVLTNAFITAKSVGIFLIQIAWMTLVSFAATLLLAFILSRITHHIKYLPIILLTVLIYALAKESHLPALLFIMIFGLFLGNLDELKHYRWIEKLRPEKLNLEVHNFKDLATEAAFLVRVLFFLLFGYTIEAREVFNVESLPLAAGVVAMLYLIRSIFLALFKLPQRPLLFIAPRGLITILLFLSVDEGLRLDLINHSLVVQVVLLTALLMMLGMLGVKTPPREVKNSPVTEAA